MGFVAHPERLITEVDIMKIIKLFGLLAVAYMISGCAPEVGSDAWCEALGKKSKADWSTNEALDFAKNCLVD